MKSNPSSSLSIVKDATTASYSAAGQTINYTILATNTGTSTLHNVTITDANAVLGTCTPAIPVASLAPGGTISCAASHVVTQAEVDAGHYSNTACVDDCAGPAAQVCHDSYPPPRPSELLSIVKDATTASYSAAGQTINYTILATNTGTS